MERLQIPKTLSILQAYYHEVLTLESFLVRILQFPHCETESEAANALLQADDSDAYRDLLRSSYVALDKGACAPGLKVKIFPPVLKILDVIDRAQARLFLRFKGKPSNIITAGYRSGESRSEHGKVANGRTGISNYFVNTMITALQSHEWRHLLSRIGEDAMLHLLVDTSIYVTLPNGCLCQIVGRPLMYIPAPGGGIQQKPSTVHAWPATGTFIKGQKRKLAEDGGDEGQERPRKRQKVEATPVEAPRKPNNLPQVANNDTRRTAADISFARVRMFYSRTRYSRRRKRVLIGLPTEHLLNRLMKPEVVCEDKPSGPPNYHQSEQAAKVRHFLKYMFPLQFQLRSILRVPHVSVPFAGPQEQLPYFLDREEEIKQRGSVKTPTCLKGVLEHLGALLHRHGKCHYRALCNMACPSKLKSLPTNATQEIDHSFILDLIAEQNTQLLFKTQMSHHSNLSHTTISDISAHRKPGSTISATNKQKPRFAEFTCSHGEVFRYARLATKAIIPGALWGCKRNFRLIMKHVLDFITFRRYETTTLHNVMQGFSTAECDWLLPKTRTRVSLQESLRHRELVEEFIYWYFDSFLIPLLNTTFYITESGAFRNRVLYFRQDDWEILCRPLIDRLASNTFERITQHEAEELLRNRKLGYSFVRLLPKETGVRPIVNLRRRRKTIESNSPFDQGRSINQILQTAFSILTYEKDMCSSLLGASVFGPNEIYTKMMTYKTGLLSRHAKIPTLYFVKVDVQACFDTIEQSKLLTILKRLISEDGYMVQRYGEVSSQAGKIKRTYRRNAIPDSEHPEFLAYARELANILRNVIFVDQVTYPFGYRDDILQLLEEHITSNLVKIGHDYYKQIVGVPQGSVLSSLLCSFFYGDLENSTLKPIIDHPDSVLLRLIDDYLFITTDLSRANRFLDVMLEGHPEYGCFISKEKTLTNFDNGHLSQFMNVTLPTQKSFPWCGFLFDMRDLSISVDYTRFHERYLQDSLTVARGRNPSAAFTHKMLKLSVQRIHVIYVDTSLNTPTVVHTNIYQNFLMSAMKMHSYLRSRGVGIKVQRDWKLIRSTVRQLVRYNYTTIRGKITAKTSAPCNIKKADVQWLGTHAFHAIFSLKRSSYERVLDRLAFELALPRYRGISRRWNGMTRRCLEDMLVNIAF